MARNPLEGIRFAPRGLRDSLAQASTPGRFSSWADGARRRCRPTFARHGSTRRPGGRRWWPRRRSSTTWCRSSSQPCPGPRGAGRQKWFKQLPERRLEHEPIRSQRGLIRRERDGLFCGGVQVNPGRSATTQIPHGHGIDDQEKVRQVQRQLDANVYLPQWSAYFRTPREFYPPSDESRAANHREGPYNPNPTDNTLAHNRELAQNAQAIQPAGFG